MTEIIVNVYLRDILKEQAELNSLYSPKWKEVYSVDKLTLAAISEIDEMQREVELFTTFFGAKTSCNFHLALEEFIDILHFSATKVLLNGYTEDELFIFGQPTDICCDVDPTIPSLIIMIAKNVTTELYSVSDLKELFEIGLEMFNISPDLMLTAYLHKNSKNRDRALAGAMNANIDHIKSNEVGTYDYLRGNWFISLTKEEWNNKLRGKYDDV